MLLLTALDWPTESAGQQKSGVSDWVGHNECNSLQNEEVVPATELKPDSMLFDQVPVNINSEARSRTQRGKGPFDLQWIAND